MATLLQIVDTLNVQEQTVYQTERLRGATARDALAYLGYGINITGVGGALDRGSADAYYGRVRRPHCKNRCRGGLEITSEQMLDEEIAAYNEAYDHENTRKQWE